MSQPASATPGTGRPPRRLVALAVVALVMLGAWFGLVWLTTANERQVARVVGKQLGCPAADVTILSSSPGDTAEVYEFEACGQFGRATCLAPDFECAVQVGPGGPAVDCTAERRRIAGEAAAARTCSVDDDCTLLVVDGLFCRTPVSRAAEPRVREQAARWRAACKPAHADCFAQRRAACVAGACAAVDAPGPAPY